ncbi:hypothetical protein BDD12DRAFT_842787 [Trichophaea hybrida]|nr:hypothetical protein BDD12DRAFT_842787 [Trichophaea hybrida]
MANQYRLHTALSIYKFSYIPNYSNSNTTSIPNYSNSNTTSPRYSTIKIIHLSFVFR